MIVSKDSVSELLNRVQISFPLVRTWVSFCPLINLHSYQIIIHV